LNYKSRKDTTVETLLYRLDVLSISKRSYFGLLLLTFGCMFAFLFACCRSAVNGLLGMAKCVLLLLATPFLVLWVCVDAMLTIGWFVIHAWKCAGRGAKTR